MARRANYGFEKRQRELEKRKKKEAKAEKKRLMREAAAGGDPDELEAGSDDGGETSPADGVSQGVEEELTP